MPLIKRDDGSTVVQKDWGPTLIGIRYMRPCPASCRVVSWDMERLQSSLLRKYKPTFKDKILTILRIQRMYF
jgi:hypothetical protein